LTPSAVTMLKTGSGPRSTRATSFSCVGWPSTTATVSFFDVGRVPNTSVSDREIQMVVLFLHPRGCNQVVVRECVGQLLKAQMRRFEPYRFDHDVEFGRASADQVDSRDTGNAQESDLQGDWRQSGR